MYYFSWQESQVNKDGSTNFTADWRKYELAAGDHNSLFLIYSKLLEQWQNTQSQYVIRFMFGGNEIFPNTSVPWYTQSLNN